MGKACYHPLLGPGAHRLTLTEARSLCVEAFSTSVRRPALFAELLRLLDFLDQFPISLSLWLDGSYLTEKIEPDDIDVVVEFWADEAGALDPTVVEPIFVLNGEKRFSPVLDTYLCVRFLREDPRSHADRRDYWAEVWGKGWDDWLKGYAVVAIGESDVQRRIIA